MEPSPSSRPISEEQIARWSARISRRDLLRGGATAGLAGLAAGGIGLDAAGAAPARAVGLGPGGTLLAPGSRPYPDKPAGTDTLPQIENIVVLMMENHSFDDHLGMLGRGDGFTLGSDGQPINYNPDPAGGYVTSFHEPNTCGPDHSGVTQSWNASHLSWDNGTNMGFVGACGPLAMGYWDQADLPFYYGLAGVFPIGDRYFCSVMAQTYPNRRFLTAATALGDVSTDASGISHTLPPNGTIFQTLNKYGITWKDYYPDVPTAAIFLPTLIEDGSKCVPINDFFTDAAAGTLPQFSLVDPYTNYSEENNDISIGEAFAARIIDAVLTSPQWSKTALIWTYDEHGGYYDHVPPQPAVRPDDVPPEITVPPDQPGAYDYTGFRVPVAVVSPYAKRDYVSHQVYDHTSILKLVETKWNLPALTYRDANARDMLDFFDFTASTPPFLDPPTLPAPLNPFVGPLPPTSSDIYAPGFHPVCEPVPADTLPPASSKLTTLPAGTDAKLAAQQAVIAKEAAAQNPSTTPPSSSSSSSSSTPVVVAAVAGAAVVAGVATLAIRSRRHRPEAGADGAGAASDGGADGAGAGAADGSAASSTDDGAGDPPAG